MELGHTIYTHEKFTEQDQYWCPESEEYAAASQLISALRAGWTFALPRISARQIWNSGSRPRTDLRFHLNARHTDHAHARAEQPIYRALYRPKPHTRQLR